MGVGFPAANWLDAFGLMVRDVFGEFPCHVGSSLTKKTGWRDVDVRLILPDEDYEKWGLGDPKRGRENAKWRSLCEAYSVLGSRMTGLSVDFQIQQRTYANKMYDGRRSALGIVLQRE